MCKKSPSQIKFGVGYTEMEESNGSDDEEEVCSSSLTDDYVLSCCRHQLVKGEGIVTVHLLQ